jgi:pyruvate kinase
MAVKKGYLKTGDMVISLAAMPLEKKGMVNTLRVSEVKI